MKKLLLTLFCLVLLVSCVSTSIEYYATPKTNSNKVYMQLDQSSNTVSTGGVGYMTNYGWTFMGSSTETVKLGTIKNREIIKNALISKGFEVVNSIDDADIVMIGENSTNEEYTVITLGFYEKQTNQLLYVCEGKYGLGWGLQDDLNKAVKKALESIPNV